jgi:hypothetical protein
MWECLAIISHFHLSFPTIFVLRELEGRTLEWCVSKLELCEPSYKETLQNIELK